MEPFELVAGTSRILCTRLSDIDTSAQVQPMTTVSKTIRDKAERLLAAGRVIRINLNDYAVQGDTSFYKVSVTDAESCVGTCTCRRWSIGHNVCSHIFAACEHALQGSDRFEGSRWQEAYDREKTLADPFDGLT